MPSIQLVLATAAGGWLGLLCGLAILLVAPGAPQDTLDYLTACMAAGAAQGAIGRVLWKALP
jgi:hypothetical protein